MKASRTYFLTSYMEYLLCEGLKCEETYVADASRFIRYLLVNAPLESVKEFVAQSGNTSSYRRRLISSLNRFLNFAEKELDLFSSKSDPVKDREA